MTTLVLGIFVGTFAGLSLGYFMGRQVDSGRIVELEEAVRQAAARFRGSSSNLAFVRYLDRVLDEERES